LIFQQEGYSLCQVDITQQHPLPKTPRPIVCLGAGGIMRDAHLPAYSKANFEVAGLYDQDREAASKLAADFQVSTVFESLEGAIRNAPEYAVFDIAVPASAIPSILPHLPDGAAVLIQKPMGENIAEARTIRSICRQKKLTAAVNFQLRYAPNIAGARSLIGQGIVGDVHDIEINVNVHMPWQLWSFLFGIPRVEILYHSVHYVDLIRSFLGDPEGVYAKTTRHPAAPEMAPTRSSIILDYGDDIRASITTHHGHDYGDRYQWAYTKWEGTRGAIRAQIGVVLDYPRGRPDTLEYCLLEDSDRREWISVQPEGNWYPDAFVGPMANLQCFLEGSVENLPTSVEDAYHTMAVVEAAYITSKQGGLAPVFD
jgi:predicted dehydrogenase